MGIFDKIKKDNNTTKLNGFSHEIDKNIFKHVDNNDWFQVFSACLGKISVIQWRCEEAIVSEKKWSADLAKGSISFGDSSFPVQIIGSEGNATNSWQWAYKNINNFNDNLLTLVKKVKQVGESWGLSPLFVSDFELDEVFNGETLSIIACGLFETNYCYYRAVTQKGSLYVAFTNVPKEIFDPVEIGEFAAITAKCLEEYYVDHKVFVESFLLWNDTPYDIDGDTIIAHFEVDLFITFEHIDGMLRVSELTTK